jgi:uncharacterized protein (DUF1684 family)
MTVTLQLKPEIEAHAVQLALAQGKRIEDFLAGIIETNLTKTDDWRLEAMREAMQDEFFLADLAATMEDFRHVDTEQV